MRFIKCAALAVAGTIVLLDVAPTLAVDTCRVRVDNKTGVIRVNATGVAGPLTWGVKSGQADNAFFDGATCVAGSKASGCELANPTTLAAKTPPAGCTLFVDDGVEECGAWIAGCTPGFSGYVIITGETAFNQNSPYTVVADCPAGKKVLGGGGSQGTFGWFLDDSRPKSDGTGWVAQYAGGAAGTGVGEAWAICANVPE